MNSPKISPLQLLVAIVERGRGEAVMRLYPANRIPLHLVLLGQGTARSELLDTLGLERTQKDMVLTLLPAPGAGALLARLARGLGMHRPGGGIAFTVPLTSITRVAGEAALALQPQEAEKEEEMGPKESYDAIVVVLRHGYSDRIMDAARAAGASGGTVVHARALGSEEAQRFIRITIQPEKELVLILTPREQRPQLMQAIAGAEDFEEARGLMFSVPAEHVTGLTVPEEN